MSDTDDLLYVDDIVTGKVAERLGEGRPQQLGRGRPVTTATNAGRWDRWYDGITEPAPYGDTVTYAAGATWLADCTLVEDWGCGKGWMRLFIPPDRYRGIDGSQSPFADAVVDLTTYRSDVPGIFIRHVLEHNYEWRAILDNAASSARKRLCLVLFTPLKDRTVEIAFSDDPGVPDLAFALSDLTDRLDGWTWTVEQVKTDTQYESETILRCQR